MSEPAMHQQHAAEESPRHVERAPVEHTRAEHTPVEHAPVEHTPAVPPAPPAAIHAVSEHDAVEEETHRPNRRRRQDGAPATPAPAALELVETSGQAAALPLEDELPRRTKPRRRRSAVASNEPLQLVETDGETQPDNATS